MKIKGKFLIRKYTPRGVEVSFQDTRDEDGKEVMVGQANLVILGVDPEKDFEKELPFEIELKEIKPKVAEEPVKANGKKGKSK